MKSVKRFLLAGSIIFFILEGITAQNVISIQDRRELFVDYFLIEKLKNAEIQMHKPINQEKVLFFDHSWEGNFSGYCTVIKDGDHFKAYYRAPHIYVAIGARFMPGRQVLNEGQAEALNVNPKYYNDCSDAFFMTSRGGSSYDRTFMESFIRPGIGLENWVSRSNYPALNVVQTSPIEMSVNVNENYAQPTAHLKRYSLRIDGFASLASGYEGGEELTKPFTFEGSELEINYSTSAAGAIRMEILDGNGDPIPGYTMDECQEIIGNEISRIVSWDGKIDVSNLSGKPVRLRIFLKDADLYALKFNKK